MSLLRGLFASWMCMLSAISVAAELDSTTIEGYWKRVTFDMTKAMAYTYDIPISVNSRQHFIPNGKCYIRPEYFVGCVNSLIFLGAYVEPALTVIPKKELSDPSWAGAKVVTDMGLLQVVEIPEGRTAAMAKVKLQDLGEFKRVERAALLEVAAEAFNLREETGLMPIDFRSEAEALAVKIPANVIEAKKAVALTTGYLLGIDAHARLELTELLRAKVTNADSALTGIGAEVTLKNGLTMILRPLPDSPSLAAGLQAGDLILEVDGQSVRNMKIDDVVRRLRGPENTSVTVLFLRDGEEVKVSITRKKMIRRNVEARVVEHLRTANEKPIRLGLLTLRSFMDNKACTSLATEIERFQAGPQPVSGLILDLRGNLGGDLEQARCVGSLFVGRKNIVFRKNIMTGKVEERYPGIQDAVTSLPMVVLIDANSASASEIVSGSLQGLKRAWIVGDRSFGKGSVQTGRQMLIDSALVLFRTTSRFYMPYLDENGVEQMRTNQRVGVQPDFFVLPNPNVSADEAFTVREGDLLPYSLGEDTKTWELLRPPEQAKINTCMTAQGRADEAYVRLKSAADYRLLKSEEVLACELGL